MHDTLAAACCDQRLGPGATQHERPCDFWTSQRVCQGLSCLPLQGERRMLDDPSETEAPHSLDQWTIRPLGAWLWPVALVQA